MTDTSLRLRHGRTKSLTKICLTAAVSTLAIGLAAPAAFAQNATSTDAAADGTVVVVTGQRKAAQSAQNIKRKNDLVVDSIVASDVGKLPDNSVADALARVTGVQIRRDSGESNSVLIRGLPNVVTLLNGREVFTTSGRFIALADVPANMLQRVDVFKSSSAEQIEGGIAGTIDIRTRRPFDFAGAAVSGNARVAYNDKAKASDPTVGLTASNRWTTGAGEVGALIGLSYTRSHYHEERAFNVDSENQTGFFNATHPAPAQPTLAPFVMGYIPIEGDRRRSAVNYALQWRPDADTELYSEGFYTQYKNKFELDFLVGLPLLGDGNISGTVYPGTHILKTLTDHNVFTIMSTQANRQISDTYQVAFGGSHVAGQFKLSTDLSYTKSTFNYENPIVDSSTIVPLVKIDTNHNGTAQLDYGDEAFLKNSANYSLANWFDNYGTQKGESLDWRADVAWTPASSGLLQSITGGVRFADRKADSITSFVGGFGGPITPHTIDSIPGLAGLSAPMASGGPDYITTQWFTPSANFLLDHTDQIRTAFTGTSAPKGYDPGSLFSDNEKTSAIYGQAKLGGDLGAIGWSGIFGLRVVQTKEDLNGNISQDTDPNHPGLEYTPISIHTTTTDALPSMNLRFSLQPDLIARLTAGRTITRPNFSDLNPGVSLSTVVSNTTGLTGGGGNPHLKPVKSDNFDGSLEWYFASDGFLTATAFYRKLEGYVASFHGDEIYGGLTYRVTRPTNSGKGHLNGLEVGYQQFYDFLPGILSGLGLQANATYMDGQNEDLATGKDLSIVGLSKYSYNIIGLYEKNGWSGRLAYNWRSGFLDTRQFNPGYDLRVRETAQMDGSVSYKFNANTTFTLEANNLLDTRFKDYFDDGTSANSKDIYPRDTRRYDRTIMFGVRFTM